MTDRAGLRDQFAKWMYERDARMLCWPEDSRRAWDRLVPKLREPWEKDADAILALIEPLVGVMESARAHVAVAQSGKVIGYALAEAIKAPFTEENARANEEYAKTWEALVAALAQERP